MFAHPTHRTLIASALALGLVACGGDGPDQNGKPPADDTLQNPAPPAGASVINVGGRLFSVPSPVETALLIKKLGMDYRKDLPLPTSNTDGYATKAARGLALGMFGADMAYVTVHQDGQRALATLQAIEKLGAALDLSNAFDKALLDRFKNNLTSEDSLLRMSGEAYRMADQYLKTNERDDVSALVLAGGWIESMYLTVATAGETVNEDVARRVGEQKRTLGDLIALIEQSDKEKASTALLAGLNDLRTAFEGVATTYQFEPPVTDARKKITHINCTSTVAITPGQLRTIAEKVTALRSTLLA